MKTDGDARGGEIVGVQQLRAIAATLVVISHVAGMMAFPKYFGTSPGTGLEWGYIGVDLFFVISGFIIVYVSLDAATLRARLAPGEFMRRRFIRIVPFMWVCVLGYLLLRLLGRGAVDDVGAYLRALTLWPVGRTKPETIWTLRHELLFYLVFALACLGRTPRPWMLAAWLLAPLLAVQLWPEIGYGEQDRAWHVFLLSPLHLEFGFGALMGLLYLRRPAWWRWRVPAQFLLLLALAALTLGLAAHWRLERLSPLNAAFLGCSGALMLACALFPDGRAGLLSRLGHAAGDASYAIYLTHPALVSALLGFWAALQPQAPPLLVLCVCTLSCLAAGYAAHRWVERPLIALLKRRSGPPLRLGSAAPGPG